MSNSYTEILEGVAVKRPAPGPRHEQICARLHEWVQAGLGSSGTARLLNRRSEIRLSADTTVCPDLALVTVATGKLWLAAEIVSSEDHHTDTLQKKEIYENLRLPRLWMIDPRYDNVEVYHGTGYGLSLKEILAGREILKEKLLPEFLVTVADLFRAGPGEG
jgi:Uma2 family endonuclease